MNIKTPEILKYPSALHNKLRDALKSRLRMSESKMKDRYAAIARNEETFQAFIPEQDVDALRRLNRENNGVPEYRTIEIPYPYAQAMTAHTYYTSVFCARTPVFQLTGRHGEAEQKVQANEALLAYQMQVAQWLLPIFVWLLDPSKAGFAFVGHYWDKEITKIRQRVQEPVTFLGVPVPDISKPGTIKQRWVDREEHVTGFEGSRLYNVRPQDAFPDPRVALVHFQKGEFFGRYVEVAWNEIYAGSRPKPDGTPPRYFNYDALKALRSKGDKDNQNANPSRDEGGRSTTLPNEANTEDAYNVPVGFIKGHEVYMRIIPRDWKLAESDEYEMWVFNISTNGVIFGATPLGEYHDKFPFDILVDEVDGYTLFPGASIERIKPLSDVLSWLVNSHFYNVRQTLNNQFVVDPSMVVMKDVENPEPGKIIRLKPAAYGKDVRMAINQLQTVDVTSRHIQDIPFIQGFMERVTGANDSMMGMMQGSGRKTATEVRTSTSFGINRLKTQCEWYSITGFSPLTQKLVQRQQQRYSAERQYRIVGDLAQFAPQFVNVTPADIAGFYDYEPVDGTLPVDRFAQANLWQMILGQLQHYPQIMMQYDIAKIFAWIANLAGIKNVAQFRLVDPAVAQANLQAGNVVPISQAAAAANINLNEPRQLPGVGATG